MAQRCETHAKQHRTVNATLLGLLGIGFALMIWHIITYGSTPELKLPEDTSVFAVFFYELWHMIVGGHGFLAELGDIWLYFLFGIMLSGYIRTYKFHIRLRKTLVKHGFLSIFIAATIGVFSPLCSCGILATVIGLLSSGLPLAPAMALLISSPLMSPTAFFLTIIDLGVEWTAIRVLVAFLMGVFAGIVTHLIRNFGFATETLFIDGGIPEGDFHDHDYADERLRCTCNEKFSNKLARKVKNHANSTVREWKNFITFLAKTTEMTWMVGKYVLVGIFVGVIAENYIPQDHMNSLFGTSGPLGILYVTLGSIPIFLHQISASSILYHIKEALPGTMDPGAGLAFLIGGPVTALPAMTLLWAMFKKRVFVLYLCISIFGTLFFAYSFRAFVFVPNVDSDNPVLRGIASLPAGKAAVFVKEGENGEFVHVAANPGGNNLLATYEDLYGGSGIVFDAGLERFFNENAESEGNQQYILNIAKYLDETSQVEKKKSILIYNTYSNSGLAADKFDKNAPVILAKKSYNVKLTDRAATPRITSELLEEYNQLWILSGESESSTFTQEEIDDILFYRDEGIGLLIVSGPDAGPQDNRTKDANQIASNFGVRFSGMVDHGEEIPISSLGTFFSRTAESLVGFFGVMRDIRNAEFNEHDDHGGR